MYDISVKGSKVLVVLVEESKYSTLDEVYDWFDERAETQTFLEIHLDSFSGPAINNIRDLENSQQYKKLIASHKRQKLGIEEKHNKYSISKKEGGYLCVNFLIICIIFYGGYQYLKPIGWHVLLESTFPKIFSAWKGHHMQDAYSITYAWIYIIAFLSLPSIFLYFNKRAKNMKLLKVNTMECIFCIIFSFGYLLLLSTDTQSTTKISVLFFRTHVFGLFLHLGGVVLSFGVIVFLINQLYQSILHRQKKLS